MIDWLTLKIDATQLSATTVQLFRSRVGRVLKLDADGQVEWETVSRENIRSDSHQVTLAMGSDLTLTGSPARVMERHNVFGSGDPVRCARAMIDFVSDQTSEFLPDPYRWRCTRMDVTLNYDMLAAANVRQALMALRHAEGGRYQLRTESETVYWSVRSKRKSGKAYHKGPHLQYLRKQGNCHAFDQEIELAQRLLRLELSLRSMFWREQERQWHEFSEQELEVIHSEYFDGLIGGGIEVTDMNNAQQQVIDAAKNLGVSEGQGKSAWLYWCAIQSQGMQYCREHTPRTTHYRHVKILKKAGFSFADFQAQRIIPIRKAPLVLAQPVRSWADMRAVA